MRSQTTRPAQTATHELLEMLLLMMSNLEATSAAPRCQKSTQTAAAPRSR